MSPNSQLPMLDSTETWFKDVFGHESQLIKICMFVVDP